MALLVRLSARSNYKLEIGKSNTIFPQSWNPEAVSVTSTPAYSMMFFFFPYDTVPKLWRSVAIIHLCLPKYNQGGMATKMRVES